MQNLNIFKCFFLNFNLNTGKPVKQIITNKKEFKKIYLTLTFKKQIGNLFYLHYLQVWLDAISRLVHFKNIFYLTKTLKNYYTYCIVLDAHLAFRSQRIEKRMAKNLLIGFCPFSRVSRKTKTCKFRESFARIA